ncbi:uncharacterized protein PpBr36_11337, partial [Pyricularia pennisetigena]|uniref:uncharacterized protein n=1 Tax=Pyricularia pennisetigena TaxID=1578925 RepID=UPI00115380BC
SDKVAVKVFGTGQDPCQFKKELHGNNQALGGQIDTSNAAKPVSGPNGATLHRTGSSIESHLCTAA